MKSLKKQTTLFLLCVSFSVLHAQNEMKPAEGYTPQIGYMVAMLEETKNAITESISALNQTETDFMFDTKANSIGALLMHVMATEAYFQVETLEGRTWTDEEKEFWGVASGLGATSKEKVKGKPITYYLELWNELRKKTLDGLKTKNDAWFASNIEEGINNHWAWFHILEHQANHMGQIAMVKNRLAK
ncbi:MAG: hypothetical protein COA50_06010 [Flavobacteriaceae bacterium]|nr:MAG: hypothetical protein COA50_06010 [Flavobacteriaceae bacterium]